MARLTIEQIKAPDLSVASQALSRAGDSFQTGMSNAASLLGKYQAGVEEAGDAEIFQEIAKLKNEDELNAYFSSNELAGRPMSAAMRADIMNRRDNVLGYEKQRADTGYVGAGTDSIRSRTAIGEGNAARDWRTSDLNYEQRVDNDAAALAISRAEVAGNRYGNNDKRLQYQNAIGKIESDGSGGYAAVGATDPKLGRALGKYQIMEANIPQWSKAALGKEVSVDEFMNNPDIQDAIFDHRFGMYVDKYGEEQAAQAWFGGEGGVGKTSRTDVHGKKTIGTYGQTFMDNLGLPSSASAAEKQAALTQAASPGLSYGNINTPQTESQLPVGMFGNTGVSNSAAAMLGASLNNGPMSTPVDLGSIQLPNELPSAGDFPSTVAPGSLQMPANISSTEVQAPISPSSRGRQPITENPNTWTPEQVAAIDRINNLNLSAADRKVAMDQVLNAGNAGQAIIDAADEKDSIDYLNQKLLDISATNVDTAGQYVDINKIVGANPTETVKLRQLAQAQAEAGLGVLNTEFTNAELAGAPQRDVSTASLLLQGISESIESNEFLSAYAGAEVYKSDPVGNMIAALGGMDAAENVKVTLEAEIRKLARDFEITPAQAAYSFVLAAGEDDQWLIGADKILSFAGDGLDQRNARIKAAKYFKGTNSDAARANFERTQVEQKEVAQLLKGIQRASLLAQQAERNGNPTKAAAQLEKAEGFRGDLWEIEDKYSKKQKITPPKELPLLDPNQGRGIPNGGPNPMAPVGR